MESKRRDLMDFIVDMEQYSLQMSQQLKELDDSFTELKGVCQEEAELLEKGAETVRKLRKAYEDVAGKVDQYIIIEYFIDGRYFNTVQWLYRRATIICRYKF